MYIFLNPFSTPYKLWNKMGGRLDNLHISSGCCNRVQCGPSPSLRTFYRQVITDILFRGGRFFDSWKRRFVQGQDISVYVDGFLISFDGYSLNVCDALVCEMGF